jgi:chromate reductase
MSSKDTPRAASPEPERGRLAAVEEIGQEGDLGRRTILALCGSLRRDSYNRRLLAAVARALPPAVSVTVFERLREIPPFDEDDEATPPEPVAQLRAEIGRADALLIATPEYNGSLPGQLKNALDWASRPFETNVLRGKPVAVIGASPSPGGTAQANADTRRILARIGAQPSDATLIVPRAFMQLDAAGSPTDPQLAEQLARVAAALVASAAPADPQGLAA